LEIEKGIWKGKIRAHASMKDLKSCDRIKREVYAKKEKGIFIIKKRMRRNADICERPVIQRIHLTIKVAIDISSSLCSQKGWEVTNGIGLPTCKSVNSKK